MTKCSEITYELETFVNIMHSIGKHITYKFLEKSLTLNVSQNISILVLNIDFRGRP